MRRLAALLAVAALCVFGAGCGADDSKPSSALDDALGYFAADAPFVMAIETDPEGAQIQRATALLGRFPGVDQIARRLGDLTRLNFGYEQDIRRQLGAPLVVGLTRPAAGSGLSTPLVIAMRLKDPLKAKQVLLRQPGFRGGVKSSGTRIYEDAAESRYAAVDGDVLVAATNRDILEQALSMHRSANRMRAGGFGKDLAGLPAAALVRVSADPRTMIGADARLRPALDVKWLASMRRLGATVKVADDGVALDLRVHTDPGRLEDADLPLAPRPGKLQLIGGNGDIQLGVREPARLMRLAVAVWQAVTPHAAARVRALEPPGVDLEHQLPRHLADAGVAAVDPFSRAFAGRVSLRDPAGVRTGLRALAPVLPEVAAALGVPALGLATPAAGESFYALAKPNGKTVVFGVVGGSLVAASEARRASELASAPTHAAPGPPAAAVVTVDARTLAAKVIAQRLGGAAALAAPFVVASLRDLTGWLTISRSGLIGHLKLTVVR